MYEIQNLLGYMIYRVFREMRRRFKCFLMRQKMMRQHDKSVRAYAKDRNARINIAACVASDGK